MTLILVRVDDRLIHGQVTVGWVQALHPDRILLVNDVVATNHTQKKLYEATVLPEMRVSILTIEEAMQEVGQGAFNAEKIFLIIASPEDALILQRRGLDIKSVNVGGLHYAEGKRRLLPYVFASEHDVNVFRELLNRGIEVECRDVPSAKKVDIRDLL